MSDEKKSPSPAYVAYATFKNSIRTLKHGNAIPDRIDPTVFGTMSGSAKNQLFGALKFFGLVDDKGVPAPRLRELATSDENGWNKAMGEMVHDRYREQVKVLKTGTPQMLRESFGDIGGIVKPAVRFLLAACKDTGIDVSPLILREGSKGNGAPKRRRVSSRGEGESNGNQHTDESPQTPPNPAMSALLDKFPTFDPAWKPEQQTAWFDAYKKLIDLTAPKGGGT